MEVKKMKRYSILQMIEMMDEKYKEKFRKLYEENREKFLQSYGSASNHQPWVGGYHDHFEEVMNIALVLYKTFRNLRTLPFTLSDVLIVSFCHDLEKPWKYMKKGDGLLHVIDELKSKDAQQAFRLKKLREYGIILSDELKLAIKYVEGESSDYVQRTRVMGPLAALCHMADVASARIWFDRPKQINETWKSDICK